MPQPSDAATSGELRQPVVMIGGTPLGQLHKMFDDQARAADPLSVHLPEIWGWHHFMAVMQFLEQNIDLPVEQLAHVILASGNEECCLRWLADPEKAWDEIEEIRQEFWAEFEPGQYLKSGARS